MGVYDFQVTRLDGEAYPLSEHKGQVLLVVNTASQCGFTPQYEGLEALHREYGERGLIILGFPCNQFGKQEPGNADDIRSFCSTKYDVTFPMHAISRSTDPTRTRCTSTSRGRDLGCWAPSGSSGTSPSSCSTAPGTSSNGSRRSQSRSSSAARSKPFCRPSADVVRDRALPPSTLRVGRLGAEPAARADG